MSYPCPCFQWYFNPCLLAIADSLEIAQVQDALLWKSDWVQHQTALPPSCGLALQRWKLLRSSYGAAMLALCCHCLERCETKSLREKKKHWENWGKLLLIVCPLCTIKPPSYTANPDLCTLSFKCSELCSSSSLVLLATASPFYLSSLMSRATALVHSPVGFEWNQLININSNSSAPSNQEYIKPPVG
jgi:hypothetical protein